MNYRLKNKGWSADNAQRDAANERRAQGGQMPTKRERRWRAGMAPAQDEIRAGLVMHMQLGRPGTRVLSSKLGPPSRTVDRCPGCSGPRTESNWSNSPRMGLRFCSIACAIKKKAELRDASGGAA